MFDMITTKSRSFCPAKMSINFLMFLYLLWQVFMKVTGKGRAFARTGSSINVNQYPFVVQRPGKKHSFCSASYIEKQWLLTSAYCLTPPIVKIESYMGVSYSKQIRDPDVQKRRITEWHRHPKYQLEKQNDGYNLGLLKINEPFNLNNNVQLVRLPRRHRTYDGLNVVALGWGIFGKRAGRSDTLRMVQTKVWTNNANQCNRVPRKQICVGKNSHGVNFADFGGPLIQSGVCVGIMAHRQSDGVVYENVHNYMRWIRGKTRNE